MNNLVQLIASCFVNSLWEVTAIGTAGWVVSLLFGRLGPRFHHLVWVTTLGLAAITPAVPLLRSLFVSSAFLTASQPSVAISVFDQQAISHSFRLSPASVFTLFLFFLCTFVWSVARLGWSLRCTIKLRQGASAVLLGTEAEELWSHCKRAFSVAQAQILRSETVGGLATIDLGRPVLLISDGFIRECQSQDVLAAFAHECAHIKRRDFQKNLLYEVASLGVAYHPATWFVKSQIARTREMACDEMATEKLMGRQSYAESLLRLAKMISLGPGGITPSAIGIFDANVLEERIMKLKKEKRHFGARLKYGAAAGSILLLLAAAAGIGAIARPIETQSARGSSTSTPESRGQWDLACTYYYPNDSVHGVDGSCETHKGDKIHYFCSPNSDRSLSEEQIGCKSKIEYAKSRKVKVQNK
jgi:beta-lactamase regulating signal transducer with metallopeptidase domain